MHDVSPFLPRQKKRLFKGRKKLRAINDSRESWHYAIFYPEKKE